MDEQRAEESHEVSSEAQTVATENATDDASLRIAVRPARPAVDVANLAAIALCK